MLSTTLFDLHEFERLGAAIVRQIAEGVQRAGERGIHEAADEARATTVFKDRSGDLRKSIKGIVEISGPGAAAGRIEALAAHASYLDQGTKPHRIYPKQGQGFKGPLRQGQSRRTKSDIGTHRVALRWFDAGGAVRFAKYVDHPGTRATGFMGNATFKFERVVMREIEVGCARAQAIADSW